MKRRRRKSKRKKCRFTSRIKFSKKKKNIDELSIYNVSRVVDFSPSRVSKSAKVFSRKYPFLCSCYYFLLII